MRPQATAVLLPVPQCAPTATMVVNSKAAPPKAAAKGALEKKTGTVGIQATGFRNLMKYRASEQCKKAWAVWGSRGPTSYIDRIR